MAVIDREKLRVSQSKVVPLEVKPKVAITHPVLTANLRDQTRSILLQLLNGLFDCTDDALFELADRSSNDADHHLYFHSMRQIRLQRTEIEQKFLLSLMADYDRLFQPHVIPDGTLDAEQSGLYKDDQRTAALPDAAAEATPPKDR